MKTILNFLIITFCFLNLETEAQNASGKFTSDDLGSWAYLQYNSICAKVYLNIENNRLITYFRAGKKLNKTEVLKYFENEYAVFLSTDADDPRIGKDSIIRMPVKENFFSISLNKTQIIIKITSKTEAIAFDRIEFEKLLQNDLKLFLELYASAQIILLHDLPTKSIEILRTMNLKLYKESLKSGSKVFKNDSLTSVYTQAEVIKRGSREILAFISTDPSDPTIGKDTLYSNTLENDIADTSFNPFLYFTLSGSITSCHFSCLAAGFNVLLNDLNTALPMYLGFISIENGAGLNPKEMTMLEFALWQCLQDRLIRSYDIENYREYFKLDSSGKH